MTAKPKESNDNSATAALAIAETKTASARLTMAIHRFEKQLV
jgi:hypothetical protein